MASGNGFSINYKLLFGAFFLLVEAVLEIRYKTIFFHFFLFLTAKAVFQAGGNRVFMESFIPASGNGFSD